MQVQGKCPDPPRNIPSWMFVPVRKWPIHWDTVQVFIDMFHIHVCLSIYMFTYIHACMYTYRQTDRQTYMHISELLAHWLIWLVVEIVHFMLPSLYQ